MTRFYLYLVLPTSLFLVIPPCTWFYLPVLGSTSLYLVLYLPILDRPFDLVDLQVDIFHVPFSDPDPELERGWYGVPDEDAEVQELRRAEASSKPQSVNPRSPFGLCPSLHGLRHRPGPLCCK